MININIKQKISLAIKYPKVAFNTLIDKLYNPTKESNYPRIINCFITEKCNFKCPMCHVSDSREKHLTHIDPDVLDKLIEESKKYGTSFQLAGGEPLMYPNISKIINKIHRYKMPTGLVTNGLLLEKQAEDIYKSGLDFLAISLDGPDEETQYKRGFVKNSFNQLLKGLDKIVSSKGKNLFPNIRIATVITKNNIHNFHKIQKIVENHQANQWSISHLFFYNEFIKNAQKVISEKYKIGNDIWGQYINRQIYTDKEIKNIDNKIKSISTNKIKISVPNYDLKKYYSNTMPGKKSFCSSPFKQVFIRGNGDVEMCHGYIIGNLKNDTLYNIWHNKKATHFRDIIKKRKTIPACFRCCALDIKFD